MSVVRQKVRGAETVGEDYKRRCTIWRDNKRLRNTVQIR